MNIEDVIKVCGQLSQTPNNIPNGNNNGSKQPGGGTLLTIVVLGLVAYLGYKYLIKPTLPKIKPNEE